MSTTLTRWVGATLAFLLVAWIDQRYGHAVALAVLMALLVVVAIWGGSGQGYGRRRSDDDRPGGGAR